MKSRLIIGMGKFGKFLAKKLTDLGNHVVSLDINAAKISELTPYVTTSRISDATQASVLDCPGIDTAAICVVAFCANFLSSLQTSSLLKEGGAHHVLACACTEIQEKFLLRNGADEVVFAEKQVAERTAVLYSANNMFDYVQLTPEYAIYEIPMPKGWEGKSIREKDVRSKYNLNILAVQKGDKLIPLPSAEHIFDTEERLMVMCRKSDISKFIG